jgi:hypothetical protein
MSTVCFLDTWCDCRMAGKHFYLPPCLWVASLARLLEAALARNGSAISSSSTPSLTAHLGGTDMQSDKPTDDKPAKVEPPRCKYCGTTEAPIFVRAHLECPKCHTVTESCCDGGRCG